MKLYIKQKVFSIRDKFNVLDELGDDRYHVEGEIFSLGRKLRIYDMHGQEAARIEQKIWSWMPCYDVYIGDRQAAQIHRRFSWFHPRYEITGPAWTVEGSFWEHSYEVKDSTQSCIVRISKEWMTWGDSYELDIASPEDELLALAVVLTIDCVTAASNN